MLLAEDFWWALDIPQEPAGNGSAVSQPIGICFSLLGNPPQKAQEGSLESPIKKVVLTPKRKLLPQLAQMLD